MAPILLSDLRQKALLSALLLGLVGSVIPTACGGGGNNAATVRISLSEWKITGQSGSEISTLKAGNTKFEVRNEGQQIHELVLIKTDTDPATLPRKADGTVDEEAAGESPGEADDIQPGKAKTVTLNLTPGRYVFICNNPDHYQLGMRTPVMVQ